MVKIGKAANLLGVSVATLRKWEVSGELLPTRKTKGGTRYYDTAMLLELGDTDLPTIAYARVWSPDQKADLDRQHEMLETYCAARGWRTEIILDFGSGMSCNKKGLHRLLEIILQKQTKRIVLTYKDCLLRFGAELVFTLCELQDIEVVIIHKGESPTFEQDWVELVTVLSARLYGSRSNKNRKLLEMLQAVADRIGDEFEIYDVPPRVRKIKLNLNRG